MASIEGRLDLVNYRCDGLLYWQRGLVPGRILCLAKVRNKLADFLSRHRLAEQVALNLIQMNFALENFQLFHLFNALDNDQKTEISSHARNP